MADPGSQARPDRRIRTTPLVFGVAFVAIGVVHLSGPLGIDATWAWVLGLSALAVAGLVSAARA